MEIRTRGENYPYNPFEGDNRKGLMIKDSQVLFVYRGDDKNGRPRNPQGYPASPLGNRRNQWGELYLPDAKRMLDGGDANRLALLSQMGNVIYTKYRSRLQRISSSNASFARLIINIALNFGFRKTIISIDESNLLSTGLKITAARDVLYRLHSMGVIIYLRGRGTENKNRRNIPMGFVLHPCVERAVLDNMELLNSGKMDLEGLQYIDVKVRDIN